MRRRAKPDVDLALASPLARPLGTSARLLEGLLDLLRRRARIPARDRRSKLRAALATRDLLQQLPGRRGTNPLTAPYGHAP